MTAEVEPLGVAVDVDTLALALPHLSKTQEKRMGPEGPTQGAFRAEASRWNGGKPARNRIIFNLV